MDKFSDEKLWNRDGTSVVREPKGLFEDSRPRLSVGIVIFVMGCFLTPLLHKFVHPLNPFLRDPFVMIDLIPLFGLSILMGIPSLIIFVFFESCLRKWKIKKLKGILEKNLAGFKIEKKNNARDAFSTFSGNFQSHECRISFGGNINGSALRICWRLKDFKKVQSDMRKDYPTTWRYLLIVRDDLYYLKDFEPFELNAPTSLSLITIFREMGSLVEQMEKKK